MKKMNAEPGYKIQYGPPFKLFRFPDLFVELGNILLLESEQPSNQKSLATTLKQCLYYDLKAPNPLYSLTFLMSFAYHLYVIRM